MHLYKYKKINSSSLSSVDIESYLLGNEAKAYILNPNDFHNHVHYNKIRWYLRLYCYAIESVSTFCVVLLLDMVVDTFQ